MRLLSRNANDDFSDAFWERRVRYAWDYRKTVMGETDSRCCRVIFGEADLFPGLTVDRFESVLVAQVLCLGMELIKEELFSLLLEVLRSDGQDVVGVYERNDVAIRALEGMEQGKGWHPVDGEKAPDFTAVDIEENGIRYTVDFENGQKTGFFLDQKYNRLAVSRLAKGRTVLDCFTHTGSFALNAARGGAAHVTAVDVSEFAVQRATENARRNGVENARFLCDDAGRFMQKLAKDGNAPDVVMMDPPRAGSDQKFLQSLLMLKPKRVVYVSCNPETLARDLRVLVDGGYRAEWATPVDMFPGTEHVETVCALSKLQEGKTYRD